MKVEMLYHGPLLEQKVSRALENLLHTPLKLLQMMQVQKLMSRV
jgi:hypothetical protein